MNQLWDTILELRECRTEAESLFLRERLSRDIDGIIDMLQSGDLDRHTESVAYVEELNDEIYYLEDKIHGLELEVVERDEQLEDIEETLSLTSKDLEKFKKIAYELSSAVDPEVASRVFSSHGRTFVP